MDFERPRPFNLTNAPKPNLSLEETGLLEKWLSSETLLEVEIGAGVGLHAIQWSSQYPNRNLIAIERTHERSMKLKNRVSQNQVNNVLPIQGDATLMIPHYLPSHSIEKAHILYPNPNPLSKHKNQRWVHSPMMHNLLEALKPGNENLVLATNIENYAQEALEGFTKIWGLKCVKNQSSPFDFEARTHFEKKYLERGESCFNLVFSLL